MKNFKRDNQLFSLCGLNCALCRMKIDGYCNGCGSSNNQGRSIASCSLKHNCDYCFKCNNYLCEKYRDITKYDSFITHRNQLIDMDKAKVMGIDKYNEMLKEKSDILKYLLNNYNDGRRKIFFCLAIKLLDLDDIHNVLNKIKNKEFETLKDKSLYAVKCFEDIDLKRNIILKLNNKH